MRDPDPAAGGPAPPLRIAVDASAAAVPNPSGVAVYIAELLKALPRAAAPGDRIVVCHRLSRLRRRRFWVRPVGSNVRFKLFHEPWSPIFPRRLDVFHGPDVRIPAWRRPARVATIHDLFSLATDRFGSERFRATRERHYATAAAEADRIITHSETVRRAVIERLGVAPGRVVAVPLAARPRPAPAGSAVRDAVARRGLAGRRYAIAIGEISVRKDTAGLIEAFGRARAAAGETDDAPVLLLVGRDGFGADEVRAAARAAGADAVRLAGWLPDDELAALLAGATAFVQNSRDEGFGIAVLEAMAAGVPVVATAAGAVPEVAGDAALLAPPGRPDAMGEALGAVLGSDAKRADLIARGRERAAGFDWDATARRTLAVYREAVAARRGGSAAPAAPAGATPLAVGESGRRG